MEGYHGLMHWIAALIGHEMGAGAPDWLHAVLHVVLVAAPLGFAILALLALLRLLRRRPWRRRRVRRPKAPFIRGLPPGAFRFVLQFSRPQQLLLVAAGLGAMPVLYATLELPKVIINNAISSDHFPVVWFDQSLSQTGYLFLLCALYLAALLANALIKFGLNTFKGRVAERLLRRLRLLVFRRWRAGAGSARRSEVIPLIAQEVEPIGGFAADAFALPVFQGGTFVTILVFMFVQDPVLGAAALTLLPVQLALIPRLQRKINALARRRVAEIRALGGHLGDQAASNLRSIAQLHAVGASLKEIEAIRLEIHRTKYFMKSLSNFLTALTPFFFYSIGGYLVIEERLTLGALVAVLAAYKDFSAPLKELFRYYQTSEDVRIRYEEMLRFLSNRSTALGPLEGAAGEEERRELAA